MHLLDGAIYDLRKKNVHLLVQNQILYHLFKEKHKFYRVEGSGIFFVKWKPQ